MAQEEFPCPSCGAMAVFDPASQKLVCEYCGHAQSIEPAGEPVAELDYREHLQQLERGAWHHEHLMMKCTSCGASTTLEANQTAGRCPFCDSTIVVQATSERLIQPRSVLPFSVSREYAKLRYRKWVEGLWFAPNCLREMASLDRHFHGLYVPFWTYDSQTYSAYTGQRGDDFWTTESYTAYVDGKPQTRTRQVKRTRWRFVSGQVNVSFNDVLVLGSAAVDKQFTEALEPWDLKNLVPYDGRYLSGFQAQSYQVDLPQGFEIAKIKMAAVIERHVCRDIGGDHQRIASVKSQYDEITFKLILLPVWLATYRYRGKVYHIQVNARTGEVQGQRPWSYWKLGALYGVVALLAIFVIILVIWAASSG